MSAIYIITENKNYEKSSFEEKHFNFEVHEKVLKTFHLSASRAFPNSLYHRAWLIMLVREKVCKLETRPFENVKNQIGFCGIWCGSCLGGNGAVQELTRHYEQITKRGQSALEKWAPKEFKFNEFMKGLACIQAMSPCPGCRKGGGDSNCKIRICALSKGVLNCSQCNQLTACNNFEELGKNHPKIKEDLVEIKNKGQAALIEKWTGELKTKWPHCILLCEATKK